MEVEEQEDEQSDTENEDEGMTDNVSQRQEVEDNKEKDEEESEEEDEESDMDEEQQRGEQFEDCVAEGDWQTCSVGEEADDEVSIDGSTHNSSSFHNSSGLLTKDELLAIFKAAHDGPTLKEGELTVGLVSTETVTRIFNPNDNN